MRIRHACWLLLLALLLAGCSELSALTGLVEEVAGPPDATPGAAATAQVEQPAVLVTPGPTPEREAVVEPLLFVSDRGTTGTTDIYQINADGSGLIRLTDDPATESDPRWSPDRKHLAFTSDRSGAIQIYTLALEDLTVEQITDHPAGATSPTWSPDGRQIAFVEAVSDSDAILTTELRAGNEPTRWQVDVMGVDDLAWAPVGNIIAFSARVGGGEDGERDVFALDLTRKLVTNLTNRPGSDDHPAWTPKGDRLAFQTDRDGDENIYVMQADGSLQTPLTVDPASDVDPNWSSDGSRIAFSSDRDGHSDIYVMSESGADQRAIAQFKADDRQPRLSPPAAPSVDELAFSAGPLYGLWDLYVVSPDGAKESRLTKSTSTDDTMPDWSPDGTRIVFASNRGGNYDIYVMAADGSGEPVKLSSHLGADLHPAWSPDGSQIAWEAKGEDGSWGVWIMKADGSDQVNLTGGGTSDDGNPAWSPDGQRIALSSNRRGSFDIYVANADGSGDLERLTSTRGDDFFPAWSPDGALIAFRSSMPTTGQHQLFFMGSDGRSLQPLLSSQANDDSPAWSPEGQRIAFSSDRANLGNGTQRAAHNIYVYDLTTGRLQRVTHDDWNTQYPAWRPRPAPEVP